MSARAPIVSRMESAARAAASIEEDRRATLDDESSAWLRDLRAGGVVHDDAVERLHALLLRAARFETGRRRASHPHLRGDLDEIATFLNGANPDAWKLAEMKSMLQSHLALTTQEVVARLQGKWNADVRAYDAIVKQALGMADMLSEGIIHQFPARFA